MLLDIGLILRGLPWTALVTVAALAIGAVLGFPIMMMRNARFLPTRILGTALISLVRAVPPIVWLFIIFFGVGSGLLSMSPLTAALVGLGAIAATNMAEIYRGGLISIHHGQWEAAQALNLSKRHTFHEVIMPQMFRVALPSVATYAIGLLKDSAIASTIGVPEITYQATRLSKLNFHGLEMFGIAGLLYILLSLPIAWMSRTADLYLRAKVAR
ncbi:amino acid ABC transporter permease [Acidisoma sp. S159]|jgi:polar amino acid transport system permease protein|uniref:amino acid ABC transporter permease n=1 Tax=Acidisoma sp. S159 TaxID=1747225 RepID=UPI00131DC701|nr:amino acid ABC transporter permease [Acidisoma sp. S159]